MVTLRRLSVLLLASGALWAAPIVLDDGEDATLWKAAQAPAAVESSEGASPESRGLKISMPGQAVRPLGQGYVSGSAAWDRYEGLSFMVKGDGSDQYGCLAVVGSYPFVVYFPLKDTTWHRVTASWAEFAPESQVEPLGALGSLPPSGIISLRFGSRWTIGHNNTPIPPHSFWVDGIQLEETVPSPTAAPAPRPMADILARLRDREPLRIQCMGDSITAGTGLPQRDRQRYAVLMQDLLRRWLGTEAIRCESLAVGGAKSTDCRAWVPRDFAGPAPDLMTLWIGYNDKSNAFTRDYFKRSVMDYLDRVCRATNGQTAILLLATGPGCGPRFTMMDDYAEAIREIGRERGLTVFDMHAHLKAIGREELQEFYGDMAHPNADGHRVIAEALSEFLVRAAGIDTPKPTTPPAPRVPVGEARAWDFEAGLQDWTLDSTEIALDADRAASGRQALRFHMQEPGKDHRRALSPAMTAIPGQRYDISATIFPEGQPAGSYGLYLLLHASPDGSDRYTGTLPVKGPAPVSGAWSPWAGRVQIPEGTGSFRVMVWAERGTVATFRVDDIAVTPVAPQPVAP